MQHKAGTRGAHSANGRAGAPTRTAMSDRPRTPQRAWQRESGVARSQSRTDTRQHSAGYVATTDTRPDLILFTELYTQSKITTAMERRLEIFLRLEVRRFTPTRGAVELAVADWR